MPIALPSYDGNPIFGTEVKMRVVMNPSADQTSAFFGVSGLLNLFGGTRGRGFFVTGNLVGPDVPTVNAAEAIFYTYKDGIARVLSDTRGRSWPYVLFDHFEPGRIIVNPGLVLLEYRATFVGLFP